MTSVDQTYNRDTGGMKPMKRILNSLIAVMLVFCLASCGKSGGASDPAKAAVNAFLSSLKDGDLEKATSYTDASASDAVLNITRIMQDLSSTFEQMMGTALDDSVKEKINGFTSKLISFAYKSYDLEDSVKQEDGTYTVKAALEVFDNNSLNQAVRTLDLKNEIGALSQEYTKILMEKGAGEAQKYLYSQIITLYTENIDKIIANVTYMKKNAVFTVVETDGAFKIKDLKMD